MTKTQLHIKNKKAHFEYEIIDRYTAGIILSGTEIKSVRLSKVSISEAFCYITNREVWVKGMHIAEYAFGSYNNHDTTRERKLLLNKKEIQKLEEKLKDKGNTIVVLGMFITSRGWAKVDIALARGKKLHDKRESIKAKDAKRDIDRAMKR
ncbi:MAG: SsrA-binding protein SmpB [Bacteroidales bacterium]|nr:SsrA-binding protein SmpB [Bacteroidales bacterium]NLK81553.1 SsrA-binding protein SmpB [Bacteroidales bacterium]